MGAQRHRRLWRRQDAVRDGRPSLPIELMVSYLYDLIARGNPVGLFGMVNVLEGTSIALATHAAGSIRERLHCRTPRSATSAPTVPWTSSTCRPIAA
jgi:hypothetical protein